MQRIVWSEGVCVCAYVRPSATPSVQPGGSAPIAAIAALPHRERTAQDIGGLAMPGGQLQQIPNDAIAETHRRLRLQTPEPRSLRSDMTGGRWRRRFVSPRSARRALALVYVDGGVCEIAAALGREQRPWAASHQRRGLRSADA